MRRASRGAAGRQEGLVGDAERTRSVHWRPYPSPSWAGEGQLPDRRRPGPRQRPAWLRGHWPARAPPPPARLPRPRHRRGQLWVLPAAVAAVGARLPARAARGHGRLAAGGARLCWRCEPGQGPPPRVPPHQCQERRVLGCGICGSADACGAAPLGLPAPAPAAAALNAAAPAAPAAPPERPPLGQLPCASVGTLGSGSCCTACRGKQQGAAAPRWAW